LRGVQHFADYFEGHIAQPAIFPNAVFGAVPGESQFLERFVVFGGET
jgi:hypothetical protein